MKKKQLYPGVEDAERERERKNYWGKHSIDDEPDIIQCACGYAPNYKKFKGWSVEKALVWCNLD